MFYAVLSHSDLTQGLNPGLPHCRQILYRLSTREGQEYWSGQSISSPGDLPDSGIKLGFPALPADSLPAGLSYQGSPNIYTCIYIYGYTHTHTHTHTHTISHHLQEMHTYIHTHHLSPSPGDGERWGNLMCCSPWDGIAKSWIQLSDWTTSIYTHIFFSDFFPTRGYYKILNLVPYAIKWDLIVLFYV